MARPRSASGFFQVSRPVDAGTASTHLESCNGLPTTKRFYSRSELADWSSRRVTSLVHNRGRSRVGAVAVVVAVLFTGFENAQSQRRPEKPRVASVHLRPRPVALPHLR